MLSLHFTVVRHALMIFGERRTPTFPVAPLQEFFHAEDITSVVPLIFPAEELHCACCDVPVSK